jgi:hypothetical protein
MFEKIFIKNPQRLKEPPKKGRRALIQDARPLKCENTGFNGLTLAQKPGSKPVLIQACCVPPDNGGQRPIADVTGLTRKAVRA